MISFLSLPPLQVSPSLCLEVAPLSWGTCGSLCWPLLSFLCQSFSACPLLPLFVHLDKYLCAVSLIKWLSNSFCLIRPNVNSQTALWWLLSISSLIKSYFSFCNLGKWSTCSPGTDWFVFHVVTRPVIFFSLFLFLTFSSVVHATCHSLPGLPDERISFSLIQKPNFSMLITILLSMRCPVCAAHCHTLHTLS